MVQITPLKIVYDGVHRCISLTMSKTVSFPNEKAMALGGVATGNMKAREAAMVHGSITYSGCILIAMA